MESKKKWQNHEGVILHSVNEFDIIKCENCGFKHIIPIPKVEELDTIYREKYYSSEKPFYIERMKEDLEWWNIVYQDRYESFEEYLPANRKRILDIGSGPGYFLLYGKNRGWIGKGIEPSKQAWQHSKEQLLLDVINEFLTWETSKKLPTFDVIHLSEVLEHISNPSEIIQICNSLLNPGGLLCIIVPNDFNPFQNILQESLGFEPWWIAPPHHINYFDSKSLVNFVSSFGFDIVSNEVTFPIDIFLLMGVNYIGNDKKGRQCHGYRKTFEKNLHKAGKNNLKRELYNKLSQLGIGREIIIIAKKIAK